MIDNNLSRTVVSSGYSESLKNPDKYKYYLYIANKCAKTMQKITKKIADKRTSPKIQIKK